MVIWVVVFLFIAITTGNLFGSAFMREYRLATKGKQTTGTLSALQLSNHAGCRYTYAVGGVHHSHTDVGCGDGRSVGANLTVTHLHAFSKTK